MSFDGSYDRFLELNPNCLENNCFNKNVLDKLPDVFKKFFENELKTEKVGLFDEGNFYSIIIDHKDLEKTIDWKPGDYRYKFNLNKQITEEMNKYNWKMDIYSNGMTVIIYK